MELLFIVIQSHCKNSPGSHDECRTAPGGCRPLDQADRLEPSACRLLGNHIHYRHLLLLSPKADTHFTIPQRVHSLLLTHGLSPTTGQHGGRYDPQPVTRSTD